MDEHPELFPALPGRATGPESSPGGAGRYGAAVGGRGALVGAAAIMLLFGGSFTLGGGWALWTAILKRNSHEPNAWILWPLALVFLLIGLGFLYALARAPQAMRKTRDVTGRYPDEPWKWRDDWAQGFVRDDSRNVFGAAVVFALLWNLVSMPAGVIGWQKGVLEGQRAALVALLFPAIGIGLLVNAVREGLRRARFRTSRLDLDAVPVPLGRSLTGTVRTHLAELPPGGFQLTVSCLRTEHTGSGSNSSTWTRVLWQDEATAPGRIGSPAPLASDGTGSGPGDGGPVALVPVAFRIPPEAASTDHHDSSNSVAWKLEVQAKEPGVDYHATFELPVYRTAESDRPETAATATHLRPTLLGPNFAVEGAAALADAPRPEPASAIRVLQDGDALVIDFPPARNPGAALGLTGFTIAWVAIFLVLLRSRAPIVFPILWGFFDALLFLGVAWMWLYRTHVRVDAQGVAVAGGFGAPGRPRTIARGDIADVRIAVGMTAGTTAYYDLKIVKKDGATVGAGGSIRHKAEADWLAARMMKALGIASRTA